MTPKHISVFLKALDACNISLIPRIPGAIHWIMWSITCQDEPVSCRVDPPGIISDHSFITWKQLCSFRTPLTESKITRRWSAVDRAEFSAALHYARQNCVQLQYWMKQWTRQTSTHCFNTYDKVLRELADKFAPARVTKPIRCQRIAVRFDDECRKLRRHSRMLERCFWRTRSPDDHLVWVQHERERHRSYRIKEDSYWLSRVAEYSSQPRKLWKTFSSVMELDKLFLEHSNRQSFSSELDWVFCEENRGHSKFQPTSHRQLPTCQKLQPFSIPSVWTRCERWSHRSQSKVVVSIPFLEAFSVSSRFTTMLDDDVQSITWGWMVASLTETCSQEANLQERWTRSNWCQELPADIQSDIYIEVGGATDQPAVDGIFGAEITFFRSFSPDSESVTRQKQRYSRWCQTFCWPLIKDMLHFWDCSTCLLRLIQLTMTSYCFVWKHLLGWMEQFLSWLESFLRDWTQKNQENHLHSGRSPLVFRKDPY